MEEELLQQVSHRQLVVCDWTGETQAGDLGSTLQLRGDWQLVLSLHPCCLLVLMEMSLGPYISYLLRVVDTW